MKEYIYQRAEYARITTDANGKVTGKRNIFTRETDEDGNLKEISNEEYNLNDGKWALSNNTSSAPIETAKKNNIDKVEAPKGKFKDGDILKAEYSDHNEYAAYKDGSTAYWVLTTSLCPGKNFLYGTDGEVNFEKGGFDFDKFDRATRDEAFAVEKFIEANTGFRWDWRNKELVKV